MSAGDLTTSKLAAIAGSDGSPQFLAHKRLISGSSSADTYAGADVWLASQSPRRQELLGGLGVTFQIKPSHIDESTDCQDPKEVVQVLSIAKAQAIASELQAPRMTPTLVLGSDTIVVLDREIIGKPTDRADAIAMLQKLSGRCHQVFTGIALVGLPTGSGPAADLWYGYGVSDVTFRPLALTEIECYVDTGEPMDKAGAYALQGTASSFVARINGCYTNVIGLSVPLTVEMLRRAGYQVLGLP